MSFHIFRGSLLHDNNGERIDKAVRDGIKQFHKKYKEFPIKVICSVYEEHRIEKVKIDNIIIPVEFSERCEKGYSFYLYDV